MYAAGVAMGVDVLQSAIANITVPGINSLLLVRAAIDVATSSETATQFVAHAQRGTAFLYPLSDATGDGRIIEAAATIYNNSLLPDYRVFIYNDTVRALMPDPAYLEQHIAPLLDYRYGIFVRHMNSTSVDDLIVPQFNPGLFQAAGQPYPNASSWGPDGFVWPTWPAEQNAFDADKFQYFSPSRTSREDIIVVSNLGITPQMRMSGLSFWTTIQEMGSPQWRYDQLASLVTAAAEKSAIDLEMAKWLITFLAPDRTPGFWGDTVDGIISACDLSARVIDVKGGYWVDDFIRITLPAYLNSTQTI
jgi:hypothetical protein